MTAALPRELGERARRFASWVRAHPAATVEIAIASLAAIKLLLIDGFDDLILSLAMAAARGISSFFALLAVDRSATLATGGAAVLRLLLVFGALIRWSSTWPRRRIVWAPHLCFFGLALSGMSFAAISTRAEWALLSVAAIVGWIAVARRRFRFLALAPLLVCLAPAFGHSPMSLWLWSHARLWQRCAANDGVRPDGLTPSMTVPKFYSVTQLDDELSLLVGERGSWWLRRRPSGGWEYELPSAVRGNLWQGYVVGRHIWLAHNHEFIDLERLPPGSPSHEKMTTIRSPNPPGVGKEDDLNETSYDPAGERVFAAELIHGGIRALSVKTGAIDRYEVGGFNLQYMRRRDGMLVGIDTARLVVFDPDAHRIVESHAAGIGVMGIDICPADDTVATADFAGRVRLFARAPSGEYHFSRGVDLRVPRRLMFSPDCAYLAVTAGDDATVSVVRLRDLAVVGAYHIGPAVRDVTFVGPREFAVADACGATFFHVDE